MPKWNTISISGYHIREAGCTAAQEVAFTLADGIAYVEARDRARGLDVDEFARRLSFFFNGHNNFLEEVAKFRAARRMWAKIMSERFGAKRPELADAALPHADRRRHADRPAAGEQRRPRRRCRRSPRCSAARSRCTPTPSTRRSACRPRSSAKIALRTQQVIAYESGAPTWSTRSAAATRRGADRRDRAARSELHREGRRARRHGQGDRVPPSEIDESAWGYQQRYRIGQDVVVGVNEFVEEDVEVPDLLRVDPKLEEQQVARLKAFKADRDQQTVDARLEQLREAARGDVNLLYPMKEALADKCTIGEVCGAMQDVFGKYAPTF